MGLDEVIAVSARERGWGSQGRTGFMNSYRFYGYVYYTRYMDY